MAAALDIIDVPKGHHGFDMLDHTEESRAAVTKALDWAIAHLGEEPGGEEKLLVPPPAKKTTARRRTTPAAKPAATVKEAPATAEPAGRQAPPPPAPAAMPAPAARLPLRLPAATMAPLADLGAATVAAVTADTYAARVVAREHSAYAAHDLEGFLAMYSPTARIRLADGTELKGRRFLREHYSPRFEAGRCKTEVVQKLMLGDWVVEHVLAYDTGEPTAQLALYRVTDGLIVEVEFRA